jgi:hypothetical protein
MMRSEVRWDIECILATLIGKEITVRAAACWCKTWHRRPPWCWTPVSELLLADDFPAVHTPVYFLGTLTAFRREGINVYARLTLPPSLDEPAMMLVTSADGFTAIIMRAGFVKLAFPFDVAPKSAESSRNSTARCSDQLPRWFQ